MSEALPHHEITKKDISKIMFDAYKWWMQKVSETALEAVAGGSYDDCMKAIVRQLEHAKTCHDEWSNTA